MKLPILLVLPVLIMLANEAPAQTPGVSGSELMEDCKNYPNSARPRTCALFATSFAEIARSNDRTGNPRGRLCIGEDVPADEIIAQINDWLARHPNQTDMNGYEIAYSATQDRYRCR